MQLLTVATINARAKMGAVVSFPPPLSGTPPGNTPPQLVVATTTVPGCPSAAARVLLPCCWSSFTAVAKVPGGAKVTPCLIACALATMSPLKRRKKTHQKTVGCFGASSKTNKRKHLFRSLQHASYHGYVWPFVRSRTKLASSLPRILCCLVKRVTSSTIAPSCAESK